MSATAIERGCSVDLIDTPCLIVDMDLVDKNIEKLFSKQKCDIRPHLKTVKNPALAKMFLEHGAVGVCVAKLSEAEVMAEAGIEDILITTEIIGAAKIERLSNLLKRHHQIRVVVDSVAGVEAMQEAAGRAGMILSTLIELNVGQNRAGVEPGEPALELAHEIARRPNLNLMGVQGYEGHLQLLADEEEKKRLCAESMQKLMSTAGLLRKAGYRILVVTTGGTGTFEYCAEAGATEVQPGSFIFMDGAYRRAIGAKYDNALTLISTVISKPSPNRCVVDAGFKSLSTDSGNADLKAFPEVTYRPAGDEHGILESPSGHLPFNVGDRVELIPSHIDTTINLHDYYYCHRGRTVEMILPISARGKVQ